MTETEEMVQRLYKSQGAVEFQIMQCWHLYLRRVREHLIWSRKRWPGNQADVYP